MYKTGYRLRLADGRNWLLCSNEDTKEWVDRFAGIMGLQPLVSDDISSRILVIRDISKIGEHFGEFNWSHYNHYGMTIRSNSKTDDLIYVIREESSFENNIYNMWACVYPIYKQALLYNGTPLHAALVERNGMGVLLAAPGGTGKTTAYRRLPESWGKLGDDECLIVPDNQGSFSAHPFPTWSNFLLKKSQNFWQVESYLPVGAIFFLQPADKDEITPLKSGYAATLINQSVRQIMRRGWSFLDHNDELELKRKLIDISVTIAKNIPAFMLHLSLTGRFWEKMEAVLEERSICNL
ncbi:MAG: SynChlorMet cassette protein ScmC [Candidatus Hatepunaea meridiana]|nr:SynChlorMet cassette protein ScmC [Candidatus Hatepunaea meridiana]